MAQDSCQNRVMELPDRIRTFLTEKDRFAAVSTINEDGSPHQTFIWYTLDPDDRLRINSRPPRRWWKNIMRDGKVAVAIADAEDQLRWVGLSGVVEETITGDAAREDIIGMAYRYHDGHPDPKDIADYRGQDRHTFLVRIVSFHDHLE
jgi:PPOX class probable F420-dependent enzyme